MKLIREEKELPLPPVAEYPDGHSPLRVSESKVIESDYSAEPVDLMRQPPADIPSPPEALNGSAIVELDPAVRSSDEGHDAFSLQKRPLTPPTSLASIMHRVPPRPTRPVPPIPPDMALLPSDSQPSSEPTSPTPSDIISLPRPPSPGSGTIFIDEPPLQLESTRLGEKAWRSSHYDEEMTSEWVGKYAKQLIENDSSKGLVNLPEPMERIPSRQHRPVGDIHLQGSSLSPPLRSSISTPAQHHPGSLTPDTDEYVSVRELVKRFNVASTNTNTLPIPTPGQIRRGHSL
ncbi:hypothetical protein JAAARDRAFT_681050 [Jaapia argillacea MUCL 33604]|uniref:Uncharacterized protein n=1 Tax=Jaapia argillacea MUCL 33604 TaxID=933084 RepID=A0A067P311_9AGAM|nr:hypothetical protein JAAARDRAFT_681050 [Jaapia argillacea MUCL 33604]